MTGVQTCALPISGNTPDTFSLTLTNTSSTATMDTSDITLDGGDSASRSLIISDTTPETYYAVVTATSAGNSNKTGRQQMDTIVKNALTLTAAPISQAVNVSDNATYTLTIENTGNRFHTRSEEHTSELQSHSFISYAVFCLKKKKYIYKLIKNYIYIYIYK